MENNSSFYSERDLDSIGFKSYGSNVFISKKASFYSPELMSIGNNVRIDDFCILSGQIVIGNNIHISAYCALYGSMGITFMDNSGCSARTTIYSAMDDFSGEYLVGPMQSQKYTHVSGGNVIIGEYVQLGAHCLVFPNVHIGTGAVIGALSLVTSNIDDWTINVGIPARCINTRKQTMLNLK